MSDQTTEATSQMPIGADNGNPSMEDILSSIRVVVATMLVCVAGYAALILGVANVVTPDTARGSLITDASGQVIGSHLVAQGFTEPRYFWPRPSAVDYDAAGAGGSNLSPANPDLTTRAETIIAAYGVDAPIPADLVTKIVRSRIHEINTALGASPTR